MKKLYTIILLAFVCTLANAQYHQILDFAGTNGRIPYGSLYSDGTFLYGMSLYGGTKDSGVVFRIKPDGTGDTVLLNFLGATNGKMPDGSFISDGTFLYGTASKGGAHNMGVIFKIKPNGTGFADLLDFAGISNGSRPLADLFYDGTFLYGMTYSGGTGPCTNPTIGCGTIFKIMPNGTGYVKLHDFTGDSAGGGTPHGSLISDGTFLYGMANGFGTGSNGIIFKIKPDGTGFLKLLNFTGINGLCSSGSLFYDGIFLYGLANGGPNFGLGVIFKIKPDGTGYSDMHDFSSNGGEYLYGSLISDGTYLYGMTEYGTGNAGSIFKIKPDGTGFADMYDLLGGKTPYGSLISDGIFLYGMASAGGANNDGVIFKYQNVYIAGNTTICAGQPVTLTAKGGATYSWNTGATTTSIIVSPTITTTYTVTATSGTFVATATTIVTVSPSPIISGITTICIGQNTTLSASGGSNYSWSTGNTTPSIVVSPTSNTTYSVIATGCVSSSATTVAVHSTPVANFNASPVYLNNPTSFTDLSTGGVIQWVWNFGDGNNALQQNPSHVYTAAGTYTACLTVTSSNGCTNTTCQTITIIAVSVNELESLSLITISPNPSNGSFTIQANSQRLPAKSQIEIYNVMGEKVYSTIINSQSTTINLDAPNGIYFLQLKTSEGIVSKKLVISK